MTSLTLDRVNGISDEEFAEYLMQQKSTLKKLALNFLSRNSANRSIFVALYELKLDHFEIWGSLTEDFELNQINTSIKILKPSGVCKEVIKVCKNVEFLRLFNPNFLELTAESMKNLKHLKINLGSNYSVPKDLIFENLETFEVLQRGRENIEIGKIICDLIEKTPNLKKLSSTMQPKDFNLECWKNIIQRMQKIKEIEFDSKNQFQLLMKFLRFQ